MAIFNSLGSNYKLKDLGLLFSGFDPRAKDSLVVMLADRYGSEAALTYKGREALYLALMHLQLKPGAKVAVNGYTCYAVFDAINRAGLKPVYVDVASKQLNFNATGLRSAIKKDKKIAAVIVQNTLGTPADIKAIEAVCKKGGLPLIEDLAHSIGMYYADGREAGTVGEAAALSFSQDKVVDAVSGGAVIYSGDIEANVRKLSYFRLLKDYYYIPNTLMIRLTYSLGIGKLHHYVLRKFHFLPRPMDGAADDIRHPDTWHSNLAMNRFAELDDSLQRRQEIAEIYRNELPNKHQIKHHDRAIYLRFPLLVDDPAALISHLKKADIHVWDTWYEAVVSPGKYTKAAQYKKGSCPVAEKTAKQMINLPTHVNISVDDAFYIAEEVNAWLSKQK